MKNVIGSLLVFIVVSPVALNAEAARYRITELAAPAGADSYAMAINNKGSIVGRANDHAALWRNNKLLDLATFGYEVGLAVDINDKGQVVGVAYDDPPTRDSWKAFLWEEGKVTDIRPYKRRLVSVRGINNSSQVVGDADGIVGFVWNKHGVRDIGRLRRWEDMIIPHSINNKGQVVGETHTLAFVWRAGKMTALPALSGMEASRALAINDSGTVAGTSYILFDCSGGKHVKRACLWERGRVVALGALADGWSDALDINNKKQIVGTSGVCGNDLSREAERAFLWQKGKMLDLNGLIPSDSGWVLREAHGINDAGQIVGDGDLKGHKRAFLLTPVP